MRACCRRIFVVIMIIAYLPGKLNMRVDLDPRNFEEFRKLKDVNQQLNQQLKGVY